MRLEHPLFQRPLSVDVGSDAADKWPEARDDAATWLVHRGTYPKFGSGTLFHGHGFTDSPDCEAISGGVNSRWGPSAIAIGRRANVLFWGFQAPPDKMTKSARRAFLNAVVYISRFDGHRPLVKHRARSRTLFLEDIRKVRHPDDQQDWWRNYVDRYLPTRFPASTKRDGRYDPDLMLAWYRKNEEFFMRSGWDVVVDEDLKKLGVSNRKPEFFEVILAKWRMDPKSPLARKLARRYVGEEVAKDRASLQAWYLKNRDRLFFSDVGGYRWMVDSNPRPVTRRQEKGRRHGLHAPRLLQAAGKPLVLAQTSAAAPMVADWDGDGLEDLLVGDSNGGRLRFYKNVGKRTAPEYAAAQWVRVGGAPLQLPTPYC